MNIKIITDSASDITQSDAKKLGIEVLPLKTIFDKEEFLDGINLSHQAFYEKLASTNVIPSTSQINPFDYEEAFKRNQDSEIIVITISKKLSGCYQSANIAAMDFNNIRIIDSENVAVGEQILVKYATELVNKGLSAAEIEEELNSAKKNIRLVALLDTLEYLKKGGRISASKAMAGQLLSIKPIIGIEDGEVKIIGKARGTKNGNAKLIETIKENGGIDFTKPYEGAYTGLDEENLRKFLKESVDLYDRDANDITITTIGSTIGTHAGPGAYAIAYFKKN